MGGRNGHSTRGGMQTGAHRRDRRQMGQSVGRNCRIRGLDTLAMRSQNVGCVNPPLTEFDGGGT